MKIINVLLFFALVACKAPNSIFELYSGNVDRSYSPIVIKEELHLEPGAYFYLENIENGHSYPLQIINEDYITIIEHFPTDSKIIVKLKKGKKSKNKLAKLHLEDKGDGIQVTINGLPVLVYQNQTIVPEGNLADYYNRSGFIHPLYSPNGEILTDGFPKGHTHQNGLFNAWTNTTFKGSKVDFWNRQEEMGNVKHKELVTSEVGEVFAQIKTKLGHISIADGEVLEEEWLIHIYPIKDYFLFDLKSTQVNTSQDTLFLKKYHYGGMAFRGSKEWNKDDDANFTNSWKIMTNEGLINEHVNHTKAKWVNASGTINGKQSGLAIFGHPKNFRAPQTIRVHPDMPYLVYSPVVEGAFFIAPGEKFISTYRYVAYDGEIDRKELIRIEADLDTPVVIRRVK